MFSFFLMYAKKLFMNSTLFLFICFYVMPMFPSSGIGGIKHPGHLRTRASRSSKKSEYFRTTSMFSWVASDPRTMKRVTLEKADDLTDVSTTCTEF